MNEEGLHIDYWKKLILEKFGWDLHKSLQQRDFQFLSEEIFRETGINLSASTLRRLWTNQYKNTPQVHTLNAMASFLGYKDWNQFKINAPGQPTVPTPSRVLETNRGRTNKPAILLSVFAVVVVSLTLLGLNSRESKKPEVSLSIRNQQNEGVPATVGFDYDISKAHEPISIELSWNPYERTILDPEKHFYTGVYYYPDYHRTKLLRGDEVLLDIPVYVTTENWHALVMKEENDTRPLFISSSDFLKNGRMGFDQETLDGYLPEMPRSVFTVFTLSNALLEQFSADDLTLEFTFRSAKSQFDPVCMGMNVILKAENGRARLPVGKLGCYGEMNVQFSESLISGKTNDLSSLTTDLYNKQKMSIRVLDGMVETALSDNPSFTFDYAQKMGALKVLKFIFVGLGYVEEVRLTSSSGATYHETFDAYQP